MAIVGSTASRPARTTEGRSGQGLRQDGLSRWRALLLRLVQMPDEQLGTFDLADLNLGAAWNLPGTESMDAHACLATLDDWTQRVGRSTENWRPKFRQSPTRYGGSLAKFRMAALVTVLQRHLGVRYNLAFSHGDYDASDSRNLFLHGPLSGHGGTCVTMPLLCIAIGRRLGYPLKLVEAKEHFFARWDEPGGERFNVECTSPGFVSHEDEFYHRRPAPMTAAEVRSGIFLRSLTPRQEFAVFLKERGQCLMDHLRMEEALEALYYANQFWPDQPGGMYVWGTATILCRVVEGAIREARLQGRNQIELPNLRMPVPKEEWERWAIPNAKEHLAKIIRIQMRKLAPGRRSEGEVTRIGHVAGDADEHLF